MNDWAWKKVLNPSTILIAALQGADIVTFLKTLEANCASTLNISEFYLCSYLVPDSLKNIYILEEMLTWLTGNADTWYTLSSH